MIKKVGKFYVEYDAKGVEVKRSRTRFEETKVEKKKRAPRKAAAKK